MTDSSRHLTTDDFVARVLRYLDRLLSPDEIRQLNEELAAADGVRDVFVEVCELHAHLLEHHVPGDAVRALPNETEVLELYEPASMDDAAILPAITEAEGVADVPEKARSPRRTGVSLAPLDRSVPRRGRWRLAAAILLPLAAGLLLVTLPRPRGADATLTSVANARWDAPYDSLLPGQSLPNEPLSLKSGLAEVHLGNGVSILIEAPARLRFRSANAVDLDGGRLTATVPAVARGFTVRTPSASVVDMGTEFGVSVDGFGGTEATVFRGKARVEAAGSGSTSILGVAEAARVAPGSGAVTRVAAPSGEFRRTLITIDLVDIVAGGDGTQGRRGGGINAVDGSTNADRATVSKWFPSDHQFHPVPGRPMVAGVFIPIGKDGPVALDPAGHTFGGFPSADERTWHWLWAGGAIPSTAPWPPIPSVLGGQDYAASGHGLLFLHPNKGVCFDLDAIRRAHVGARLSRFRAICGNSVPAQSPQSLKSDFWIFVDGRCTFSRVGILNADPPFGVGTALGPDDRFLTLVGTDGGDPANGDWMLLGDPRLE